MSLAPKLVSDFSFFRFFGLASGQLLLANVILVILERRLNGVEVQMEQEHFVMHADCVRTNRQCSRLLNSPI